MRSRVRGFTLIEVMLDRMPKDPWGRPYHYLNPGIHGSIDVWTYGVDGKPVGTGKNAEIGSWQV